MNDVVLKIQGGTGFISSFQKTGNAAIDALVSGIIGTGQSFNQEHANEAALQAVSGIVDKGISFGV